jgi:TolB-like protein
LFASLSAMTWPAQAQDGPAADAPGAQQEPPAASEEPAPSAPPAPPEQTGAVLEAPAGLAAEALRVMVPDFRSPDETVDEGNREAITGLTVLQLSKVKRFAVISGSEISDMLRLEADKQVMGCEEDSSCLSEIADAMDARLLVTGTIARIGPRLIVNFSLIDSATVQVVGRSSIDERDAGKIPSEIKRAVHELAREYGGIPGYTAPAKEKTSVTRLVRDAANHPDSAMLFCTLGLGLCSAILPCLPFVPALQGLVMWLAGKEIAGRVYPAWWVSILAGYGALIAGVGFGVVVAAWGLGRGQNALIDTSIGFAGGALVFASIFVIEPLAAWGAGLLFAHDFRPPSLEPDETIGEPRETAGAWPMAVDQRWALAPP